MVLTFSSLALATTLGGGYAWAQGGFEPTTDLAPVAREGAGVTPAPVGAPHDAEAPTGYGVLGSTAPTWGPVAVSVPAGADPTDTDAAPAGGRASADAAATPAGSSASGVSSARTTAGTA
ncbi:MAG: hypothetical protein JWR42_981, partial [Marmoricola sp.]|nr:hypothetical protein [Marmoricola sp.]